MMQSNFEPRPDSGTQDAGDLGLPKREMPEAIERLPFASLRIVSAEAAQHVGEEACLAGIVTAIRDFRTHTFVVISDRAGSIQGVIEKPTTLSVPKIGSMIEISGQLKSQEKNGANPELKIRELLVAAEPRKDIPFLLGSPAKETLEFQLDNRALSIRNPYTAAVFRVQALVGRLFREALDQSGFVEIHTPKIVRGGTEGGAAVFSVNYFDSKVSLAQSPQLYKQICAGALERVYEIGAVYRAENSNTARHLTEFIGLDFELSWIRDEHDVMDVFEGVIRHIFSELPKSAARELALLRREIPPITSVPRVDYADALALTQKFGTSAQGKTLDKAIGDAVKMEYGSHVCFVYGYPENEKPFYIMPDFSRPGVTRSFDLLIDGLEISSGGQRIHQYDILVANMRKHGLDPENYAGYVQAFEYGMPPHGGAGLGLERLTQRVLDLANIRETTLFPRDVRRTEP